MAERDDGDGSPDRVTPCTRKERNRGQCKGSRENRTNKCLRQRKRITMCARPMLPISFCWMRSHSTVSMASRRGPSFRRSRMTFPRDRVSCETFARCATHTNMRLFAAWGIAGTSRARHSPRLSRKCRKTLTRAEPLHNRGIYAARYGINLVAC